MSFLVHSNNFYLNCSNYKNIFYIQSKLIFKSFSLVLQDTVPVTL